jgi:hypothetical protein
MEKNQSTIGEVSLSPIASNVTPTNPNQHYVSSAAAPGAYYAVQANSNQPAYAESFTRNANVGLLAPSNPGPSYGRWKDSICSWVTNLWPSCGCLFVACGGWHVAQSKFTDLAVLTSSSCTKNKLYEI